MGAELTAERQVHRFELRFLSLSPQGDHFAIPCDAKGAVNLDCLSERLRLRYLFARAVIGMEYRRPTVCPVVA